MTTLVQPLEAQGLGDLLALRGDPMEACASPWLTGLATPPEDAAVPLAMSGPHPRAVGSYGADCIKWAREEMGLAPRWWQALAITRQLEHDEDGVLVWREIVESGPRRIGKSFRLRIVALWRLANAERFHEPQLSMLVSKDLAVGKEIHRGAWRFAERKGWGVLRLNGAQEIETPKGDRWLLRAPNAAYGYDVGYGQVDESWGVDPQAITDGIEPALLERESPQLHLTSTAHARASSLMRRRLTVALRNADPDVLLLLWGAHPDADFADEATWRAASPHWSRDRRDLMARKYAAALAGQDEPEFDDPDPVRGWAAQYLNVWPLLLGPRAGGIFPTWASLAAPPPAPAPAALGISADAESSAWLSLGVCMEPRDDVRHIGPVLRSSSSERSAFVAEVVRIQGERACPVAIDPKGPAGFLVGDLVTAGVDLTYPTLDDTVQMCVDMRDAVKNHEVEHASYPELDAAVDAASWKPGERLRYQRLGGDISMLEAVTLARWAALAAPDYDPLDSIY